MRWSTQPAVDGEAQRDRTRHLTQRPRSQPQAQPLQPCAAAADRCSSNGHSGRRMRHSGKSRCAEEGRAAVRPCAVHQRQHPRRAALSRRVIGVRRLCRAACCTHSPLQSRTARRCSGRIRQPELQGRALNTCDGRTRSNSTSSATSTATSSMTTITISMSAAMPVAGALHILLRIRWWARVAQLQWRKRADSPPWHRRRCRWSCCGGKTKRTRRQRTSPA